MYISVPVLVAIAAAFLVLLAVALRRNGARDDLMRPPPALPPGASSLKPELEPQVRALMEGRKIDAIKLVRERTGVDLKEAKEMVERLH